MRPEAEDQMHRAARRVLLQQISDGSEVYVRSRSLWRILPQAAMTPGRDEADRTRKIILALLRALRQERRLGRGGHWSYDLNRHIALAQALRGERAILAKLEAGKIRSCVPDPGTNRP